MNERITVLFPITDLATDGAQRQLLELVKGLDKNCFKPVVLTLKPGGPMEREFREVPHVEVLSLDRKGKYDLLGVFKVWGILRRMKADVVQPFLTPATFFGLLPALLSRTPVKIVTERAGPGARNARLGYRFYLKAEDLLTRFADWSVANSQAGREYLIQRGIDPSRIRVIYNGINLSRLTADKEGVQEVRQRLALPPDGKVVGMMARMFPVKNHAAFLQAAALINQVMPDTRFALLGDGPLRSHLEDMSRELGLGSRVTFWGEQQGVSTYISAFDIAVLTSDTEGCSNALLEAMALGKPVVATDVGGNREVVNHGETGFLVPRGNPEALAEAIIALLRDPDTAVAMGQRAKEMIISRFSLESMVRQYESLYQDILREKSRLGRSSKAVQRAN
jgi:glycosyltransferase involved in cell wall biosynthesis